MYIYYKSSKSKVDLTDSDGQPERQLHRRSPEPAS